MAAPRLSEIFIRAPFGPFSRKHKRNHASLAHAKIINASQRGTRGATREERRQADADVAPGLRLEIISEEQSLGLFYSYQDSSYLTCILVFTHSPP